LTHSGSTKELHDSATLADAIEQHCVKEKVSFHTPGHKGGTHFKCGQNLWAMDVTELPGLDELAYASGVLARVQERAAHAFAARASFISTNGATAALMAAIIACASRGTHILIPRNVHRSAVNALVLTGLEPVWYEPAFDSEWNIWGAAEQHCFESMLAKHASELAGAIVVSPTYGGAVSRISSMSTACHAFKVPLIVDEAHGAHAPNAVAAGADLIVHSLHKTLSAMTQTALLHVGFDSLVSTDDVRLSLNMVQSSSPNYVLMASVESAVNEFIARRNIEHVIQIAEQAQQELESHGIHLYRSKTHDPFHLLVKMPGMTADELRQRLADRGVYAESVLGEGVLLLFGCGNTALDVSLLTDVLEEIRSAQAPAQHLLQPPLPPNVFGDQVLSPKAAYFGQTETVSVADALGRIAAECVAPCPPGNPVLVPGQRVTARALEFCKLPVLRVVVESQKGDQ
jgi:arginine/lysine/ornithine decarboxylase